MNWNIFKRLRSLESANLTHAMQLSVLISRVDTLSIRIDLSEDINKGVNNSLNRLMKHASINAQLTTQLDTKVSEYDARFSAQNSRMNRLDINLEELNNARENSFKYITTRVDRVAALVNSEGMDSLVARVYALEKVELDKAEAARKIKRQEYSRTRYLKQKAAAAALKGTS